MLADMNSAVKRYGGFELECTMEVALGRVTGLVGRNGSGKTTAFKLLLGLIRPDGGEVRIMGKDPLGLTEDERRMIGADLADSGYSHYMKVGDAARVHGAFYPGFDAGGFLRKCREYGITEDKKIKDLSRGMRAVMQLFFAVMHDARLLILDEPTSGMDVVVRDEMLDMLRGYMEEDEGRGVLISSHISSDLEGLCDDIYMIDGGRIILHEETDRLLDSYGVIKLTEQQYRDIDKSRMISATKESFGRACLTSDRGYYEMQYPDAVIEKGGIDPVITSLIKGEHI